MALPPKITRFLEARKAKARASPAKTATSSNANEGYDVGESQVTITTHEDERIREHEEKKEKKEAEAARRKSKAASDSATSKNNPSKTQQPGKVPDRLKLKRRRWVPGDPLVHNNFAQLHRAVFLSEAFVRMGPTAQSLLLYLFMKVNTKLGNNGVLTLTLNELIYKYGWSRSPNALTKAIGELTASGLVRRTVKGKRRRCARYALTWLENLVEPKP